MAPVGTGRRQIILCTARQCRQACAPAPVAAWRARRQRTVRPHWTCPQQRSWCDDDTRWRWRRGQAHGLRALTRASAAPDAVIVRPGCELPRSTLGVSPAPGRTQGNVSSAWKRLIFALGAVTAAQRLAQVPQCYTNNTKWVGLMDAAQCASFESARLALEAR